MNIGSVPDGSFRTLVCRMAFASVRGMMFSLASSILAVTGSEEQFFAMRENELAALLGFRSRIFSEEYRRTLLERAEREAEYVEAHAIRPVYFTDPDYPALLLECEDAPLMIYMLGNAPLNDMYMLGVVGTRHATAYGVDFTRRLVSGLAEQCAGTVCIVSGLAFGIDVAAHRAALEAGLPTVAVVAHGLNTIYPAQHRSVAVDIIDHGGCLVTEYTSADAVHKGNFLARNRIVAGMCQALVVAESAERGGALVTARLASGYNREVFALPGRISDRWSQGCNRLIASNTAALIQDSSQLIDSLGWPRRTDVSQSSGTQPQLPFLTDEESRLLDYLNASPDSHLNDIAVSLDIPQGRLNGLLLELEFKNLILRKPGGFFSPA